MTRESIIVNPQAPFDLHIVERLYPPGATQYQVRLTLGGAEFRSPALDTREEAEELASRITKGIEATYVHFSSSGEVGRR